MQDMVELAQVAGNVNRYDKSHLREAKRQNLSRLRSIDGKWNFALLTKAINNS